jgi:hypothetical protein
MQLRSQRDTYLNRYSFMVVPYLRITCIFTDISDKRTKIIQTSSEEMGGKYDTVTGHLA